LTFQDSEPLCSPVRLDPVEKSNVLVTWLSTSFTLAIVVAPGLTVFAALRQASAQASFRVKEGSFSTFALINAQLAHAAFGIPDIAAWAFVDNDDVCTNLLVNRRNA
jgi:hypothetical protein